MKRAPASRAPRDHDLWIVLGLVGLTIAALGRIVSHDFINYDDLDYIVENARVQQGLNADTLAYAFSGTHSHNWHPLTTLTHVVDCQVFGLRAGTHHAVSLAWHIASVVLTYYVFRRLLAGVWVAALVAALVAVHPVNVESVAWASERKNVVCLFFWLAALGAWLPYIERPGAMRYLPVAMLLALGLMAKQMLVTFPCVLLLLDYWPLGRTRWLQPAAEVRPLDIPRSPSWLLVEKLPLFALSAAASAAVLWAQGATQSSLMALPLLARMQNAAITYVEYLGLLLWPHNLSVFYPHPGGAFRPAALAGALVVLTGMTWAAYALRRSRPYLLIGWLWYLGTLVPVIGLVQVGNQEMADRYLYGPQLGLFMALACGLRDLVAARPAWRNGGVGGCSVAIAVLMVISWVQASRWKDTVTLFTHAEQIDSDNYVALHLLGEALVDRGDLPAGLERLQHAVTIAPGEPRPRFSLGLALYKQGRYREALDQYNQGLARSRHLAYAYNGRGAVWLALGQVAVACEDFRSALALDSTDSHAQHNLALSEGLLALQQGQPDAAIERLQAALLLDAGQAPTWIYLGLANASLARDAAAATAYREALRLAPQNLEAAINLANLLANSRDPAVRNPAAAVTLAEAACQQTGYRQAQALNTLAGAYHAAGRTTEALRAIETALALPDISTELRAQLEANLQALRALQP